VTVRFEELDRARRRRFCEEAADRTGLPAGSIEKDAWVCWALRALFGLPGVATDSTFRGGTSLAKGWNLIERFAAGYRDSLGRYGAWLFHAPQGKGKDAPLAPRARRRWTWTPAGEHRRASAGCAARARWSHAEAVQSVTVAEV